MTALDWTHHLRELAAAPLEVARKADAAQCIAVAAHLEVVSCEGLEAHYTLRGLSGRKAALSGRVAAAITQSCVVTLEPVSSSLSKTFALELWPAEDAAVLAQSAGDVFAGDTIEAVDNDVIDIGRILLDQLADLIDRYPRAPGATFSWTDAKAVASDSGNPFAKLKNLGRRS